MFIQILAFIKYTGTHTEILNIRKLLREKIKYFKPKAKLLVGIAGTLFK